MAEREVLRGGVTGLERRFKHELEGAGGGNRSDHDYAAYQSGIFLKMPLFLVNEHQFPGRTGLKPKALNLRCAFAG